MFVRQRMTPNPVTVAPKVLLSTAREKMTAGKFRRLPVVQGVLVGILTDRDLRQYVGVEERTHIEAAMTETPLTGAPTLTVEEVTQVMRKHQISGLPMLESGQLVGIITTSDILTTFLELTGAIAENSLRVHLAAKAGTNSRMRPTCSHRRGARCWGSAQREIRPKINVSSLFACGALTQPSPRQSCARTSIRY